MYGKTVRRRRAVLALLVALSLTLLTAYFGESAAGGLHSVQRGFLEVTAPIQDGASRALKPFRDLFGWFGDTLHARGQRDDLRKQLDAARKDLLGREDASRQLAELQGILGLDKELSLAQYKPVTARVVAQSPTVWFAQVTVNRGSSDGVRVGQPVINGEGLVGQVSSTVTSHSSIVTLITDHTSSVTARLTRNGVRGQVQPAVGNPNDLLLQYVDRRDNVDPQEHVVTAGINSTKFPSLFPPGIPIGWVTKVDDRNLGLYKPVHLHPFANLRELEHVQILTRPHGASG
ncbi:MAG: rod shape-determining protein MreC [Thermoleophilaceae bacterium]|nr:rod shape-determining protein MreC [Thermoleophilaceae bacterium]